MKQISKPILVYPDGQRIAPTKLDLNTSGGYTESNLQEALFEFPELLPVEEIEPTFRPLIPVCTELSMEAGRMDILFITPDGLPVCVETKLWRNADARREVVAQILDYASELSRWKVEDLQRVVRRRTGNSLIEIVRSQVPEINEAEFLDNVTTALETGRFLLIVCGDGIRKSTENISRFLSGAGHLDFIFALVEISIFQTPDGIRIYQPRTLARTKTISRDVSRYSSQPGANSEHSQTSALEESPFGDAEATRKKGDEWLKFWTELAEEIEFDDPNHLEFVPERRFRASGKLSNVPGVYLLHYFSASTGDFGLAFSFDASARPLFDALKAKSSSLEEAIGYPLKWTEKPDGRQMIGTKTEYLNPNIPEQRSKAKDWFAKHIVDFDNVLRPPLERASEE